MKAYRDSCATGCNLHAWPSVWSIRSRAGCWKSQATPGRRVGMALVLHPSILLGVPTTSLTWCLQVVHREFCCSQTAFCFYFPPTNFHLEILLSSPPSLSSSFITFLPLFHDSWHHQPACNLGQSLVALEQAHSVNKNGQSCQHQALVRSRGKQQAHPVYLHQDLATYPDLAFEGNYSLC